ncbi:MAG: hypothetical protein Q8O01_04610, partial [Candidatus Omnitrophota bacterium]|nr:hypothetical protein [Candidatus Omnitrophota bacterium]
MYLTDQGGDLSYPPGFTCSACPDGYMQPINYTSTLLKEFLIVVIPADRLCQNSHFRHCEE